MLYRFREAMLAEDGLIVPRGKERPTSVMSVTSLKEAEHWRQVLFRDISQKITRIQNRNYRCPFGLLLTWILTLANLSPFQVRQLNDEINQLIQEKGRWEFRVKSLGGKIHMVPHLATLSYSTWSLLEGCPSGG